MFDIDTVGGMNRAVEWTRNLFEHIKEGGMWIVPRSGTIVVVFKDKREVIITPGPLHDGAIEQVIRAMGWSVKKNP